MQIKVLGSSGSEVPGHNPPAFLIDDFLLLDAGTVSLALDSDAQCAITHIFLTHAHLDHIKAIPFLLDNMVLSDRGCSVTIFSGQEVIEDLKTNIFNGRIWPDFTALPDARHPVVRFQQVLVDQPVAVGRYYLYAAKVNHTVPAYGYLIQNSSNTAVVYTGDTGPTEGLWRLMSRHRVEALIVEVSFPDEMLELALTSGHLTPSLLSAEMKKMTSIPKRIYINHLKPVYKDTIKRQLGDLDHPDIQVLEDGMVLSL
jgi:ribonuclease BN (tRNA processing enzyme)